MGMEILDHVSRENLRTDVPKFDAGDTVRVLVRVREGDKERLQAYEGVVIARRAAASTRPSRCGRSPPASASSASSRCIPRCTRRSRWCAAAASAARSCTISVD